MKRLIRLLLMFVVIGAFLSCANCRPVISADTEAGFHASVQVRGGTFLMGSDTGKPDEKPVHEVRVSDFSIMKTEVTQKDYAALMGTNPASGRGVGDAYPVYNVSWYDAVAYANKLSEHDGFTPCYTINGTDVTCNWSSNGWRLPTEAEWEYAARGGDLSKGYTYAGSNDTNAVAWILGDSWPWTHPVGTKAANELGLYDMSGNVWEWVWDAYGAYDSGQQTDPRGPAAGSSGANRGGGWSAGAEGARVANRGVDGDRAHRDGDLGFRLARR
jgi:formylglycine-generating enzyme required for sulfatase activity